MLPLHVQERTYLLLEKKASKTTFTKLQNGNTATDRSQIIQLVIDDLANELPEATVDDAGDKEAISSIWYFVGL